jgi:hypothetical protein
MNKDPKNRAEHATTGQSVEDPAPQGESLHKRKTGHHPSATSVEADDTLEGEGSPGLTIMGGGGHA